MTALIPGIMDKSGKALNGRFEDDTPKLLVHTVDTKHLLRTHKRKKKR
jgi:hypothetical protein